MTVDSESLVFNVNIGPYNALATDSLLNVQILVILDVIYNSLYVVC